MEAFALLKFWKSTTAKVAAGTTITDGGDTTSTAANPINPDLPTVAPDYDDDDDSFFELELTLPKPKQETKTETEPKPKVKPQSPISILRSAPPKLRVFMFGNFKRRIKKNDEVEMDSNSKRFTVKFKIEDGSIVPELARTDSSSIHVNKYHRRSFDDCCESSKRFSKDVVQKYLHLIKPKSSKKISESESLLSSPACSMASVRKQREEKQSSRFKVKCRHLGKSKSASAVVGVPASFPARSECCYDGIEGAILHCKRSLNSSNGNPSLSRCSSDPSYEKSLIVSEEI